MGRRLGDAADPLLVSVRSGAKFSMPGMMDTVLNLGLNDRSVEGLARHHDERFAYDSYRRFLAMYAHIVLDLDGAPFDAELEPAKRKAGVTPTPSSPAEASRTCAPSTRARQGGRRAGRSRRTPRRQLRGAIEAVFRSWDSPRARAYRSREKIPHDLGTAVNVQAMVFGNRDDESGTGVGFTRNPATGEAEPYGDFLVNAQGEDVVAGIRNTPTSRPGRPLPRRPRRAARHLRPAGAALPRHVRHRVHHRAGQALDAPDPGGQAHRPGRAAMAVDMTKQAGGAGRPRHEALLRVSDDHLEQVLHPQFATRRRQVIAKGLAASPGAAVGKAYFTADGAAEAAAGARR